MAACVIAVNIGYARKRVGDEDKKVRPRGTGFRRFSCSRWSGRIAAGEPCLSQRYAHPRSGIAASSNHICTSSSGRGVGARSEEHTSELQSLMRISYAVFCLKKKKTITHEATYTHQQTRHTSTQHT